MKEQIEKQAIEEMAKFIKESCAKTPCFQDEKPYTDCDVCAAIYLYSAGYRKQSEGEWEWFEEWNPSTPEHPRECDDCGWRCGECKTALADIVGGYWDDPDKKPKLNFCPNCGAKMKGGE